MFQRKTSSYQLVPDVLSIHSISMILTLNQWWWTYQEFSKTFFSALEYISVSQCYSHMSIICPSYFHGLFLQERMRKKKAREPKKISKTARKLRGATVLFWTYFLGESWKWGTSSQDFAEDAVVVAVVAVVAAVVVVDVEEIVLGIYIIYPTDYAYNYIYMELLYDTVLNICYEYFLWYVCSLLELVTGCEPIACLELITITLLLMFDSLTTHSRIELYPPPVDEMFTCEYSLW